MFRGLTAYIATLAVVLAGFTLAEARGASHDVGMEIVICSGVGMTTITIGPDGAPIEQTEPCPDGTSIFAASFTLPDLPEPAARLIAVVQPAPGMPLTQQEELSPSARGPPALA